LAVRLLGILRIGILAACSGPAISRPTPLPPTPPPREIAISSAAANALSERIKDAILAQDSRIELDIREEELTSYLVLEAQNADKTVSAPRIWITPEGLWMHAPIASGRHRGPYVAPSTTNDLLILIYPTASQGSLHVTITTASWRGRALPRWLLTWAETAVNDALADTNLAVDVEQIILSEGSLRIVLVPR
jgi:hypothetical protein